MALVAPGLAFSYLLPLSGFEGETTPEHYHEQVAEAHKAVIKTALVLAAVALLVSGCVSWLVEVFGQRRLTLHVLACVVVVACAIPIYNYSGFLLFPWIVGTLTATIVVLGRVARAANSETFEEVQEGG
jgi:hypothetical protein